MAALTEFDKVFVVDNDMVLLQNIDHIAYAETPSAVRWLSTPLRAGVPRRVRRCAVRWCGGAWCAVRGARCSASHSAAPKLGDHAYLPTYLPPTSHGTSYRVTSHHWRALPKLREHAYLAPTPGQARLLAHHARYGHTS